MAKSHLPVFWPAGRDECQQHRHLGGRAAALALVARAGDQAPGMPSGVTFASLFNPSSLTPSVLMNANGEVAFTASTSFNPGIWTGTPGHLTLVERGYASSLALNATGQIAFVAGQTLWATDGAGHLTRIEGTGDNIQVAPGVYRTISQIGFAGGSTSDGQGCGLSDSGQITFWAIFDDNSSGVFVSNTVAIPVPEPATLALAAIAVGGLLAFSRVRRRNVAALLVVGVSFRGGPTHAVVTTVGTIALENTQTPDVPNNITFDNFPTTSSYPNAIIPPTIGANGDVVFFGQLKGTGVTTANNIGIWSGTPGDVALAALASDNAGGIGAGVNYQGFIVPSNPNFGSLVPVPINANGQMAYDATVTGIHVITSFNDEALFAGSRDVPSVVARSRDSAPGNPSNVTFAAQYTSQSTFSPPMINDAGHISFTGSLSTGALGIWAGSAGSLQLVAQTGQQAPGTPAGVNFATAPGMSEEPFVFSASAIGVNDRVAFTAALTGPGVTLANSGGIWAGSPGNVSLVAARETSARHAKRDGVHGRGGLQPFHESGHQRDGSSHVRGIVPRRHLGRVAEQFGCRSRDRSTGARFASRCDIRARLVRHFPRGTREHPTDFRCPRRRGICEHGHGSRNQRSNNTGIWAGLPGSLNLIAQTGSQAPALASRLLSLR